MRGIRQSRYEFVAARCKTVPQVCQARLDPFQASSDWFHSGWKEPAAHQKARETVEKSFRELRMVVESGGETDTGRLHFANSVHVGNLSRRPCQGDQSAGGRVDVSSSEMVSFSPAG